VYSVSPGLFLVELGADCVHVGFVILFLAYIINTTSVEQTFPPLLTGDEYFCLYITIILQIVMMNKRGSTLILGLLVFFSLVTSIVAASIPLILKQAAYGAVSGHPLKQAAAPIVTSGDNVYVVWSSNKTGNDEVMFKASTDSGKTFGDKMNLSNSSNSDSQDAQVAASDNNVYVSWWERNATSNEPVLRVSNDSGKTFGEKIMLSK
jgi:hypothetical protein